jgi:hypothetical protein
MYVVQNSENDDLIAIFAQKTLLNEKISLSLPMSFKYHYEKWCVIKDSHNNRSKWILSFTEIWTISIIKGNDSMLMVGLLYH